MSQTTVTQKLIKLADEVDFGHIMYCILKYLIERKNNQPVVENVIINALCVDNVFNYGTLNPMFVRAAIHLLESQHYLHWETKPNSKDGLEFVHFHVCPRLVEEWNDNSIPEGPIIRSLVPDITGSR